MKHPKTIFLVMLAIGILVMLVLRSVPPTTQNVGNTPVIDMILTDTGTPSHSPPGADVTIVVFADYQCVICKASHAAMLRVLARDARVRVLYKDWPILGDASRTAARAALASNRQGRYVAMHDALMQSSRPLDATSIAASSQRAGVDPTQLQNDLVAHADEIDQTLGRNALQAFSLGLQGVPAYLVGRSLVKGGVDEAGLERLIREARMNEE